MRQRAAAIHQRLTTSVVTDRLPLSIKRLCCFIRHALWISFEWSARTL